MRPARSTSWRESALSRRTDRRPTTEGAHIRRLHAAFVVGVLVWALIVVRLFTIQVVHGKALAGRAERQHVVRVKLSPERGTIYDRNLTPLTGNLRVESVYAHPGEVDAPMTAARTLASTLGGSVDEYRRKLASDQTFVWIERQVPPDVASRLKEAELDGIGFHKESKRVYPHGRRACHVVGMTDLDGRGLSGVELQADSLLTGSEAVVCYYVDARGLRTPTPACTEVTPRNGHSVVLTIDAELQEIAEVELRRAVREHEAMGGSVVMLNPRTGDILAMTSWPDYDPNCPSRYSVASQRNRVITDQFEPGSTFKLITAAAALETGAAELTSVYHAGRGSMRFPWCTIHDIHEYGWLDFTYAFAKSSNVCFAQIAESIGRVPLYTFARRFGFGCHTGIMLPGEVRGVLREPSAWSGRSLPTIAIGQELAATPLQLALAYGAVANDGYLMEPRVIQAVVDEDGRVVEETRPTVVRQVIEPETAETLLGLMAAVTEFGTGGNAAVAEIAVGGKTGTAQKKVPGDDGFSAGRFVSSFAGVAPVDDPRIVCLVVIDEPEGRGLGGQVAAPVFGRIMERVVRGPRHELVFGPADAGDARGGLRRYAAARKEPAAVNTGGAPWLGADIAPVTCIAAVERMDEDAGVELPDLRGMSIRAARREVTMRGLSLRFEGSGLVREQSPRPGSSVEPGDRVVVRCSP
ncbi:MAG: PASTA domain-containing protein [Candidatus Eisenbacteria bacterium]|nr:PASTA domain-containing protein [Candidatus Eisenbacteria bacterium]